MPHLAVAVLNLGLKSSLYKPENHDCLTRKGDHPSYLQLMYIHKRGGLRVMNFVFFFGLKSRNTLTPRIGILVQLLKSILQCVMMNDAVVSSKGLLKGFNT